MKKKWSWQSRDFSQRGFALLEVMVAAGILGVISMGVMKTMEMGNKTSKKLSYDQEIGQKMAEITNAMRDRATCKGILKGKSYTTGATSAINEIRSYEFDQTDAKLPIWTTAGARVIVKNDVNFVYADGTPGAYTISKMELINDGTDAGKAKLYVTFKKRAAQSVQSSWGQDVIVRNVDLTTVDSYVNADETAKNSVVTFNPDGLIDDCYVDENALTEAACGMFGGTIENGKCKDIHVEDHSTDTDQFGIYSAQGVAIQGGDGLAVGSGIALETDPDLGDGQIKATGTIRAGADLVAAVNGTIGDSLTVTNSATIGKDLIAQSNKFKVLSSTLTAQLNTTITGTLKVTEAITGNKTATFGNKLTVNSGGAEIKGGIVANEVASSSGMGLEAGVFKAQKMFVLSQNKISALKGNELVTKDFVINLLTENLSDQLSVSQKEAIVSHILQNSQQKNLETLKALFRIETLGFMSGYMTDPATACTTGQAIQSITFNSGGNPNSTTDDSMAITCIDMAGCSSEGACQTVYSSSPDGVKSFCYNTGTSTSANYQCVTSFKVGVRQGSCEHKKLTKTTIGISGEVHFYGECGSTKFMRGTLDRFGNNGEQIAEKWIICCDPKVL